MAEHRPASGDAPTRGETPSQAEQSLLVLGVCSWFCLPAPLAPNATRQALEIAGAKNERRLFPVACTRFIGS
jgi:hypothetical protein